MNERIRKPSIGFMAAPTEPRKPPPGPDGPGPAEPPAGPPDGPPDRPQGVNAKRHNLTVRLARDERDRLAEIGRTIGRPAPLSLAETVRWLIAQWRR